jgi:hypothetical protein
MARINHEKNNRNKNATYGEHWYAGFTNHSIPKNSLPEHLLLLKGSPKLPIQQATAFKNFLRSDDYRAQIELIKYIFSINDDMKARRLLSQMKAALKQNETFLPWPMPSRQND